MVDQDLDLLEFLRLFRQAHTLAVVRQLHEGDSQAVLGGPEASPGGPVGHLQLFRRRAETLAFLYRLQQLDAARPEDDTVVLFQPQLVLDLHLVSFGSPPYGLLFKCTETARLLCTTGPPMSNMA